MKIGLLVIGSEVLDGKITDLNTRFLAEFLRLHHLELDATVTVKDEEQAIYRGLHTLTATCDYILTSGGLGPTKDDVTKETLGSFLQKKIIHSPEAEAIAVLNYQQFNRVYPGKEHSYSYLPEGFIPLRNSSGFAPGFYTENQGKIFLSAPGVPREFKSIVEDHFLPLINAKKSPGYLEVLSFRTRRVPEEKIFNEVDPSLWEKLSTYGDVSSLPYLMGVDIGVKIRAATLQELTEKKAAVTKVMNDSPVKEHIWHLGLESLEQVIVEKANRAKVSFGFAESATGGLCSHRVTNVSGSSQSFMGSVICYDSKVKKDLLGVNAQTLETFGVVSTETASEMAQGLAKKLGVEIAISITGLAGPGGGTATTPVGTVCIGSYVRGKVASKLYQFHGDRETLKNRFSQAALMTLLEHVEKFA